KNRQLKNHHSYNNYNADIISYRNIRHRLGMYITKQAEQEIYLIAQKKLRWCPPPKKNTLNFPSCGCHIHGALSYLSGLTNFDSRLGKLFENDLRKTTGVRGRQKKERNCEMMPVHHFQVSPCEIIVKYGKCGANLMVSLCIHLELADVIANVSTLKYGIT